MKFKKSLSLILIFALVMSMAFVGCTSSSNEGGNEVAEGTEETTPVVDAPDEQATEVVEESDLAEDQIFRINIGQEPQILDPFQFRDDKATSLIYALHEPLFRISTDEAGYEPGLGESFEANDDNTVYTVKLRKDAKWQDGTDVTADDVVYSFKRAVDPEFGSEKAFDYYVIKNAEKVVSGELGVDELGVKKLDDYTVEFTLEQPMDYFIHYMVMPGFAPIQEEAGQAFKDIYGTNPDKIVSSGPFTIESWEHDSSITLKKNDHYWDAENVTLDEVYVTIILDGNTIASMFEVDDLDYMEVGPDYIPKYKEDPGFRVRSQVRVSFIEFNPNIEFLNNIKIREALSLTFDRIAYVENVLQSGDMPAYGLMPPGMTGLSGGDFREQAGDIVMDMGNDPEAIERAKTLLDEGLAELGKTKEEMEEFLEVLCVDSPGAKKNAQAIQQMWLKNLDLNLTVTPMQVKMLIPMLMDGTFHCVVGGGRTAQTPDPAYMVDFIYYEGKWDDPTYTEMMENAFVQVGDERIQTLMDIEKYVLEKFVFIPQQFGMASSVIKSDVAGFKTFPLTLQYDFKYVQIKN
ncbi:peptide ABC transporter substrate-binding protein [Acidaminobacter sp. JC074]|uniref:peptide ABC transporter substrate-binding protein n=1 Tax=Acidaminobacter sp. JC074 TaxID=2530199 RepID=UPI001F0EE50F|nr:peptide ABC transporter substrate-binding protein [Acidaminobacter sp. JC074]MCH4886353.1 peptide ABC transporter substrate-binding protein [Acidaminobacter sp. JC074]